MLRILGQKEKISRQDAKNNIQKAAESAEKTNNQNDGSAFLGVLAAKTRFMHKLVLKAGREKSLKRRHPWVFSGAVHRLEGKPALGDTIEVVTAQGDFLAVAAYSPQSQIVARVWDWTPRAIDATFFEERIARACALRSALVPATDTLRLVHGESDGLPGVIADRYGDVVVVQLTSAGADRWRGAIADAIEKVAAPRTIFERSDAEAMAHEGLEPRSQHLRGAALAPTKAIDERGVAYELDIAGGHKTGFYLDQRDNRALVREFAKGREVLDCFAYTGGFTLNALLGGAKHATAVESSAPALDRLERNLALNRLDGETRGYTRMEGDAFQTLRGLRDEGRQFDLIVMDPPKFAPTAASVARAARAYKDVNLLAFRLLRPGGLLFTFSCSGAIDRLLFQKIVAGAALDAGVIAHFVRHLSAGADHPVALEFPEGEYLKGLLCRVE